MLTPKRISRIERMAEHGITLTARPATGWAPEWVVRADGAPGAGLGASALNVDRAIEILIAYAWQSW